MKQLLFSMLALSLCAMGTTAEAEEASRLTPRQNKLATAVETKNAAHRQELCMAPRSRMDEAASPLRSGRSYFAPRKSFKSPEASDAPNFAGAVIYADGWGESTNTFGLYNISPQATSMFVKDVKATDGGVLIDKTFYAHELELDEDLGNTTYIRSYDIESGSRLSSKMLWDATGGAADITFDPVSNKVLGIFWADDDLSGYILGSIDYSTSKITKLTDLPGDWCAIATNDEGLTYAIRRELVANGGNISVASSTLYLIVDAEKGEVAKIGQTTGALPHYMSSMTFAPSGRLYWNVCPADGSTAMYEIDLDTGVATKLYDLPNNEEIMGLYVPAPAAASTAPAAPSALVFNYEKGSVEGSVSFTAPATFYDGSDATGESFSYTLILNGTTPVQGTCTAAEEVTVPLTLRSGNNEVNITVSNANGTSPALTGSFYAGFAIPKAPANVLLTLDNLNATLTWDAVTQAQGQGYFNEADISYNVYNASGELLSEGQKTTSFTETVAEPEGYTVYAYKVIAFNGNVNSSAAQSNSIAIGDIEPPYLEDFQNTANFSAFTVDGNWKTSYNSLTEVGTAVCQFGNGDDWLFTPGIKLKGGYSYRFSFDAACYSKSFPEKVEVKFGASPNKGAMTTGLIEATDIVSNEYVTLEAYISPESDGIYYIGIHALTDPFDAFYLYADNITVDAAMSNTVPAAISDFTAKGDANGAKLINIALTAPELTFEGEKLETLDKIEILRAGELVHTFDAPAPGSALTWTDTNAPEGEVSYSAIPYSHGNAGQTSTATGFCGLDVPAAATNLKVTEVSDGVVTVTWDAVTTGAHGGPLNPALVTYDIATFDGVNMDLPAYGLKECTATFRAIAEGAQEYLQIIVFPLIDKDGEEVEGTPTSSEMMAIGTPATNFRESFSNGMITTPIAIDRASNSNVYLYTDNDGVPSQDGDNGIIGVQATAVGASASFQFGKINLAGMKDPALTFQSFTITDSKTGSPSTNIVEVDIAVAGEDFHNVLSTTVDAIGSTAGWHPVTVDLNEFAGKTIIFRIKAETVTFQYTVFDNFRVGSSVNHDIALTQISAPSRAKAGSDYSVNVLYENRGINASQEFEIGVFADGELISKGSCQPLAPGSTGVKRLDCTLHPLAVDNVTLHAELIYDIDEVEENNRTEAIELRTLVSPFPAVETLRGEIKEGMPALNWDEPDFGNYIYSPEIKESFENGTAFATSYEGWTFVDGDGQPTGTFNDFAMPGISSGSQQSFWVMDGASEVIPSQFSSSFAGATGSKYLVSMYTLSGSNDDWAISPELSGELQFVSFYARSYSSSISEELEVLYSTTDTDPANFTLIEKVSTVPHDWTFYEVELPAGARYFAVRYCATDAFMLMLDDFTFAPKGSGSSLSLEGFNIYRNGVQLNETPIEDFEYTDATPIDGMSSYVATAVYTEGESAGSTAVVLSTSGVDTINTGINITTEGCSVVVTGAEGKLLSIHSTDGRTIYNATAGFRTVVPLAKGIYIVEVSGLIAKVLVK